MTRCALVALLATIAIPLGAQQTPIGALVTLERDVPRRVVGYGLVVGLGGTGDRSFGSSVGAVHTVTSVANLLRRFDVAVPPERLRLRNVAAVLVTAEVSPYLRAGGRFDLQVASLGDATSLRGGVLWMTPLITDVGQPSMATGQGRVIIDEQSNRGYSRRTAAGRIPDGGVLEVDSPVLATTGVPRLFLRRPRLEVATRIAQAITAAFGDGTASVEDPGSVALNPGDQNGDDPLAFVAAVETLTVVLPARNQLVVDVQDGTLVAGGDLTVGPASVSHGGFTLTIGGPQDLVPPAGVVYGTVGASVQEVPAALHSAGARPPEIATIFEALRDVGALQATVLVR